jgi:transcriptional regulator with XRE-family HTH domain
MSTAMTYGGWISDRHAATGVSSTVVRLVGWMAAAGAVLSSIGTGGEISIEHLQRTARQMEHMAPTAAVVEVAPVRSPGEDLVRIREVLRPAVSDLATTLGVSRQSVYNWLNGEPVAEENAAKLQDLAQAADVLAHGGIAVNAALLKRKFANGRTLLQVAQAGESARDGALQLVHIHKRETAQRERMAARFANRGKTAPSADFDLPSASDDA